MQGEGFDGNMPVEKPKKKSKAGVIVAVVLAAVIGGGALGYAYVPAVYDGVNNVLTAVTGKQVGVPAPIPSTRVMAMPRQSASLSCSRAAAPVRMPSMAST